jgi:hypothetical protein
LRIRVTARLMLVLAAGMTVPAQAGSLLGEGFGYPNGNLAIAPSVCGGLWVSHSGVAGADIQVAGGIAAGSMVQDYDDDRLFSSARAGSDKTYACMRVRIPAPSGALVVNYFARFQVNTTSFRSKVFVVRSGGSFTFGVTVAANATGLPLAMPAAPLGATWPTALAYDQWYTVVISYDGASGVSELWVDPESEASPNISATDATATGGAIAAFGLRQSNTGGTTFSWSVDDISVGSSFADACAATTPTTKATWGRLKTLYRN